MELHVMNCYESTLNECLEIYLIFIGLTIHNTTLSLKKYILSCKSHSYFFLHTKLTTYSNHLTINIKFIFSPRKRILPMYAYEKEYIHKKIEILLSKHWRNWIEMELEIVAQRKKLKRMKFIWFFFLPLYFFPFLFTAWSKWNGWLKGLKVLVQVSRESMIQKWKSLLTELYCFRNWRFRTRNSKIYFKKF